MTKKPVHTGTRGNKSPSPTSVSKTKKISHEAHLQGIKRKRTLTASLILAVVVLLILAVTAAAVLYITDYVAAKPNYSFIPTGTIERSVSASGLIIREEKLLTSSAEGTLIPLAAEGSRISSGDQLATIIPEDMQEKAAELRTVKMNIVDRQRQLMKENTYAAAATAVLEANTNILPIIKQIRNEASKNKITDMNSYAASIQVRMDERDNDLQSIDFNDEELNSLMATKADYDATLSSRAPPIMASEPGIVSFKVDELSTELKPEMVSTLTPDKYREYMSTATATLTARSQLKANENALRICRNDSQYFVTIIPNQAVAQFEVGSVHSIRVPDEGVLLTNCEVVRAIHSNEGAFVIFSTTEQVERLLDRRVVELDIIVSKPVSGLRVPLSALVDQDFDSNHAAIIVNSSGYAQKVTVEVTAWDREYAIIKPVEGFDTPNESTIIITNPNTVSVGSKLE